MKRVYIGTYAEGGGIFYVDIDDMGNLSKPVLFAPVLDSKYLTFYNGQLYTIIFTNEGCGIASYNENQEQIAKYLYEKTPSCYIMVHDGAVFTCNYHEGTVSKIAINGNGLNLVTKQNVGFGSHQILPLGEMLAIPCLLENKLVLTDYSLQKIREISLPKGSGPRHGILSKDGKRFYLACEKNDTLLTFDVNNNDLNLLHSLSLVDGIPVSGTAAIHFLGDNILAISTREKNIVNLVDVTEIPQIVGTFDAGGEHPRDILPIMDNKYLLVANRDSNNLVIFKYDNGIIGKVISEQCIKKAICICEKG